MRSIVRVTPIAILLVGRLSCSMLVISSLEVAVTEGLSELVISSLEVAVTEGLSELNGISISDSVLISPDPS